MGQVTWVPPALLPPPRVGDAHLGFSSEVRARAHAGYAEICARGGRKDEARAALDRARTSLDSDVERRGFSAGRLDGFDGLCALYREAPERAVEYLTRSLADLEEPRASVQRVIVGADLALARLRSGDAAACVGLMHDVVDLAEATGGRVGAQRVRRVREELRPWRHERFVTELDDHIHPSLIGR
jgi:hypothetical protein